MKFAESFPDTLRLRVTLYEPQLLLLSQKGGVLAVNLKGELVSKAATQKLSLNAPVLRGKDFYGRKDLRKKAYELYLALPDSGLLSTETVSELWHDKGQFILVLSHRGERVKTLYETFFEKMEQVEIILNYLEEKGMAARIIDARFTKKIVVKLHNGL